MASTHQFADRPSSATKTRQRRQLWSGEDASCVITPHREGEAPAEPRRSKAVAGGLRNSTSAARQEPRPPLVRHNSVGGVNGYCTMQPFTRALIVASPAGTISRPPGLAPVERSLASYPGKNNPPAIPTEKTVKPRPHNSLTAAANPKTAVPPPGNSPCGC